MEEARKRGLLVGKGGFYGNVVRMSPPLNISKADVDEAAMKILDESFAALKQEVNVVILERSDFAKRSQSRSRRTPSLQPDPTLSARATGRASLGSGRVGDSVPTQFVAASFVSSSGGARCLACHSLRRRVSVGAGGGWNSPESFPASATFYKIHPDGQCRAGSDSCPQKLLLVISIHTPQVREGEKPTNQASVKLFVVPVFPASGYLRLAAATAVPCSTTSRSMDVMMRAVPALITSFTSGKFSSRVRPS